MCLLKIYFFFFFGSKKRLYLFQPSLLPTLYLVLKTYFLPFPLGIATAHLKKRSEKVKPHSHETSEQTRAAVNNSLKGKKC